MKIAKRMNRKEKKREGKDIRVAEKNSRDDCSARERNYSGCVETIPTCTLSMLAFRRFTSLDLSLLLLFLLQEVTQIVA
jgi:hypothetical protein